MTGAEYISSRHNPRVQLYSSLKDEKNRRTERLFLAEGVKLTREALAYAQCECVLVSESFIGAERDDSLAQLIGKNQTKCLVLSDPAFEKITTERAPQGVIAVVRHLTERHVSHGFDEWSAGKRLIMFDEIRDPGNLGTMIRSAEALGVGGVILAGCADIYNQKTVRAAMGALFRMPIFLSSDAVETVRTLRVAGRRVIGATLGENTVTLGRYETRQDDCVVIGNEGHGISDDVVAECDMCVKIPMAGECESLNASSAAVCIMWEYFRKTI